MHIKLLQKYGGLFPTPSFLFASLKHKQSERQCIDAILLQFDAILLHFVSFQQIENFFPSYSGSDSLASLDVPMRQRNAVGVRGKTHRRIAVRNNLLIVGKKGVDVD